jgi:hypothetical protein
MRGAGQPFFCPWRWFFERFWDFTATPIKNLKKSISSGKPDTKKKDKGQP